MPSSKDFESVAKFDGNAGLTFDVYEESLLNVAAGRIDDRGWSAADLLLGVDEGGAKHCIVVLICVHARMAQVGNVQSWVQTDSGTGSACFGSSNGHACECSRQN